MSDEDRHDANIAIQAQAANLRAVYQRAEHAEAQIYRLAQYLLDHYPEEIKGKDDEGAVALAIRILDKLQAAQAEAAALNATLADVRDMINLIATHPDLSGEVGNITTMIDAALSGDAGAAYQREHEAMREALEYVRDNAENMLTARRISAMTLDALSASAAGPEVNDA